MQAEEKRKVYSEYWYVAFISLVLMIRVFFWFSPSHADKISFIYLWPLAIASAVLLLARQPGLRQWRFLLPAGMAFWLWVSCVVNGDAYLVYNRGFMLGVFLSFISFFLLIPSLPGARRERGLQWIAALYCGLMLILAGLGLYAALTGNAFGTPLSEGFLHMEGGRLFFFRLHPNEAGSAFVVALYGLLYLFATRKGALVRVVLVVSGAAFAWVIAFTGSRTAILLAAAGVALFLFWAIYTYGFQTRLWLRWVVGVLAGAVVMAAVYFGLSLSVNLAAGIVPPAAAEAPGIERPATAPATDAAMAAGQADSAVQADPAVQTAEERVRLQDIGTFNQRVEIWQSGLAYLKAHPWAYLFGAPDNLVARIPQQAGRAEMHMHNAYLEMLLLGGIPGLALYGLYLALLAYSGLRLAFHRESGWGRRFLGTLPLLLAVNGITEIYPLFSGNVMDMMYFALSGAVIAFGGELPPARSPAGRRAGR